MPNRRLIEVTEHELSLILMSLSTAVDYFKNDREIGRELHSLTERIIEDARKGSLPSMVPRVSKHSSELSHLYPGESQVSLCGYVRKHEALTDNAQPRCFRCIQIFMTMEDIAAVDDTLPMGLNPE